MRSVIPRRQALMKAVGSTLLVVLVSGCGSVAAKTKGSASASPGPFSGNYTSGAFPSGPSGYYASGPSGFGASGPSGYSGGAPSGSYGSGPSGQSGCTNGAGGFMTYGLCVTWGQSGAVNSIPLRTDVGFSCKLALSNGSPSSGGFIALPGGQFTLDPNSDVAISYPPGTQSGYGRPSLFGLSYNSHAGRWYPVGRESVSPDGSRYAYSYDNGGLHVINVTTGADTVLGAGRPWRIVQFDSAGIYAAPADQALGLWFFPLSGSSRQITASGNWIVAGSGMAFGQQAPSVPTGVMNPLLRLDLQSGTIQTWWANAPAGLQLAVDSAGSLLLVLPSAYPGGGPQIVDVRRMTAPDQFTSLIVGPIGSVIGPVVADSHGVWLSFSSLNNPSYTWFVSSTGYWPVSTVSGQLASGCD